MPQTLSQHRNYPIPGGSIAHKRLEDIAAIKQALQQIDVDINDLISNPSGGGGAGVLTFANVNALTAATPGTIGYISDLDTFIFRKNGQWVSSDNKVISTSADTDPYFSNVVALLHMDTGNDSSSLANSVTLTNANLTTKYGGFTGAIPCVHMSNTGMMTLASNAQFNISNLDFTVEMLFNVKSIVSKWNSLFASQVDFGAIGLCINSGKVQFFCSSNGTSWDVANGDSGLLNGNTNYLVSPNVWYHLAFSRFGNDFLVHVNGNLIYQINDSRMLNSALHNLNLGRWGNGLASYGLDGYISEFRFTKGVCRYKGLSHPVNYGRHPDQ